MPSHKLKRKFHRSGEKVSPQEKKSKSVLKDNSGKMATSQNTEKTVELKETDKSNYIGITSEQWQKLMDKIDNISEQSKGIQCINQNVQEMRKDMDSIQKDFRDLEESLNFHIKKVETTDKKLEELEKTPDLISLLEHELKATENENQLLKEQVLRQEIYSRRDNLLLDGLKEEVGLSTEAVFKKFLSTVLGFTMEECQNLLISRCHRIGKPRGKDQPRSVIASFVLDKDKNKVWQKRFVLKNTQYLIREDFPNEIINRRKLMYPLFLEARKSDPGAKLVVDKVIYRKRSYSYHLSQELSQLLHFFDKGIVRGNQHLAFHGRISIYSNFFPCSIKIGNTRYNCTEQFYQHEQCLFYGDAQAARKIMLQLDPIEMKKISKNVASRDSQKEKQWLEQAWQVMKNGVQLKFQQNRALLEELMKTTETFVEANQYDRHWGVGLPISDRGVLDPTKWRGNNWLGKILTEVRAELKGHYQLA